MKEKLLSSICLLLAVTNLFARSDFRQWASTPPMGWNSWDCYGPTVTEKEVKANADYMAEHLSKFGWKYVIVDIRWYIANDKAGGYNEKNAIYVMDNYGRYQPAENRFPSSSGGKGFKALADYVHAKGLKFGIHIMRGIPRQAVARHTPVFGASGITADQISNEKHLCSWLHDNYTVDASKKGAQEYYNSLFNLYASWGVDFVKIDDLSAPYYHQDEIELIRNAIDQCGRPIVLSTSPGETPIANADHVSSHANMWRMVNDVWDQWNDLVHLMDVAQKWYPYIGNGTWPDCDMIPLGHIAIRGERGKDRMTRLTHDEQYSLMTFFCIFRSPLFFGGDLPSMDEFTLSLLTNRKVLEMHEQSEGVRQLFQCNGQLAVASNNKSHKASYLALFNLSDSTQKMKVDLKTNRIQRKNIVEDLWSGQKEALRGNKVEVKLQPHACKLIMLHD